MVLANHDLNQVTWEQRVMNGDPKFNPSQDVPDFPFARYAEMLGLTGLRVDQPEQIGPAWDEALAANRPVVTEAVTDPEVPPLPPHITLKEAMNFSKSLLHDSARQGMIRGAMKDMVRRSRIDSDTLPPTAGPARTALPAAHFELNAAN
jgi:pyruvate dehydrogenase (quinone)